MPTILRNRELYAALLAIIAGAGALFVLRDQPWGTARRIGPAMLPGVVAAALLGVGLWHLLRVFRRRGPQAREGYAWIDLLPWCLPAAMIVFGMWVRETQPAFALRAGPVEYAATYGLVFALMFMTCWVAERGPLSRPAIAMLLGTLVGLGGIDASSGVTRLWEDDLTFVQGSLAGGLIVGLRLPLAAFVITFAFAAQLEEQLRRSMMLSAGDPLVFVSRPVSAALVGIAAVIIVAVLTGRFGFGRRRR